MGQPIPKQHPSVVLRAHFNAVRALLIVATAAVIALAAAVVILANDDTSVTQPAAKSAAQPQALPHGTRFDGGPDEGTRGPQSYWQQSGARSTYQPEPADGTKARAGGPRFIPMGPEN